jgi:DMSO/TMAO reductase YedYZ molybdopterin-dependent catalytic subunit
MTVLARRDFLSTTLLLPLLARQTSEARLIGEVPLVAPGTQPPPLGRLLGDGLDARLFTDLSRLGEESAIESAIRNPPSSMLTAADRFFVRTAAPTSLPPADPWSISLGGLVQAPAALNLRDLDPLVTTSGRYLLECSGNSDPSNFGLISTADWEGVPLTAILDRARASASSRSSRSG